MMTPILPERGDNPAEYDTATCYTPGKKPYMILNRKDNGECIYLGADGCTIHDRAPWVCRTFDCRELYKASDRVGRRIAIKRGDMTKEIFDRGRELLDVGGPRSQH
jgi:Fe-S-cluster containining protein